jgi:Histidine phosphatase superfamily (branch 1)
VSTNSHLGNLLYSTHDWLLHHLRLLQQRRAQRQSVHTFCRRAVAGAIPLWQAATLHANGVSGLLCNAATVRRPARPADTSSAGVTALCNRCCNCQANRFIGWTDPNLTKMGELEARVAGQVLLAEGETFDVIYTSLLKRSIKTAWVSSCRFFLFALISQALVATSTLL